MARPFLPAVLVFSGGIFVLLTGLVVATPGNGASYLGLVAGGLTLFLGILLGLLPGSHRWLGYSAFVLAALSVPYTYGGLVVGAFLIVLGGVLAVVWVPAPLGRASALRRSAARPRTRP